jgi:hypothetical protein
MPLHYRAPRAVRSERFRERFRSDERLAAVSPILICARRGQLAQTFAIQLEQIERPQPRGLVVFAGVAAARN